MDDALPPALTQLMRDLDLAWRGCGKPVGMSGDRASCGQLFAGPTHRPWLCYDCTQNEVVAINAIRAFLPPE